MRCLVTGVAGFIGSHLAHRLLLDGHEVCGVDAFIEYYPRSLKDRNLEKIRSFDRFTFVEADLLNLALLPLLNGVDWVFHQAAQAGVRSSWADGFGQYLSCNILATQQLLEAVSQSRSIRRFIYASSSSVYGDTYTLPIVESAALHPFSPYGVSKLAGEHLCDLYHRNYGVPTVSLRYFTVYGPAQRPDMAFHRLCKAILTHQPFHVYGDGLQTRDFTYVSDVVEANICAATADVVGKVINIAGGSQVTLREVIAILERISSSPVPIVFENTQHGDVRHTFADTQLAKSILNFNPRTSLREGLAEEFADVVSLYAKLPALTNS